MTGIIKKFNYAVRSRMRNIIMPGKHENVDYNRSLWNRYASNWKPDTIGAENRRGNAEDRVKNITIVGDEWSETKDVDEVIQNFITPYIHDQSTVLEIGCGGGRIAYKITPHILAYHGVDISSVMLEHAKKNLINFKNIQLHLLLQPKLPVEFAKKFDFIYSFDVFVHLDLHVMWKYMQEINRCLSNGGKAFVHSTNLKAPLGWNRFSLQDHFGVKGHYFVSPEIIRILAEHASLKIVKESTVSGKNMYFNRDYLAILEKV